MLDAELPELGLGISEERSAGDQRRCFSFLAHAPSTAIATPLSVVVTQAEVVVELLGARGRFANPHEALALIVGLFEESMVIDTWFSGPYRRGCAFVESDRRAGHACTARGVTRIVRRSWNGTHDATVNVT